MLGIELVDELDSSVTMCQRRHVDEILKRSVMDEIKATASPVDMSSQLMNLITAIRPYIAYAVGHISRVMVNPQK